MPISPKRLSKELQKNPCLNIVEDRPVPINNNGLRIILIKAPNGGSGPFKFKDTIQMETQRTFELC